MLEMPKTALMSGVAKLMPKLIISGRIKKMQKEDSLLQMHYAMPVNWVLMKLLILQL